jgi:hypothetical protein
MSRSTAPEGAEAAWTAPEVERPGGSLVAPESRMLPELLAWHRSTLLSKCSGLTGEQLAARTVGPSNLSLLGLLRHLRKVERIWLRQRVAGETVPALHGFGTGADLDFDDLDPATARADYEGLLDEWTKADGAVAGRDLDDVFEAGGEPFSLRFVYLHLIGEYARHNGHADLVRESLDGVTGA